MWGSCLQRVSMKMVGWKNVVTEDPRRHLTLISELEWNVICLVVGLCIVLFYVVSAACCGSRTCNSPRCRSPLLFHQTTRLRVFSLSGLICYPASTGLGGADVRTRRSWISLIGISISVPRGLAASASQPPYPMKRPLVKDGECRGIHRKPLSFVTPWSRVKAKYT